MHAQPLSAEQVAAFACDGYLHVPQLLDAAETRLLAEAVRGDQKLHEHAMHIADTKGRRTNLSLWNHPGDDIYGMVARSHRIVAAMVVGDS